MSSAGAPVEAVVPAGARGIDDRTLADPSPLDRPPARQVAALGSILGVWAHPDDEAYLSAGLMALARMNGQPVAVVTATLGELGTDDPHRWPPPRLGRLRRQELHTALAAVGVSAPEVLGYPDGGCASASVPDAVARLATIIGRVRPDTVVTFGPDGITGHPDHRTVSAWVDAACSRPECDRPRVLHASTTAEFAERFDGLHRELGVFGDDDALPVRRPRSALAVELELPGAVLDAKLAALDCHASQTSGLRRAMGDDLYRSWWSTEAFVDAPTV